MCYYKDNKKMGKHNEKDYTGKERKHQMKLEREIKERIRQKIVDALDTKKFESFSRDDLINETNMRMNILLDKLVDLAFPEK